jgi:hypothetical protein
MYIVDAVSENKSYLGLQKLFPCERLMNDSELEQMQERDNLNTPYTMSIFLEKYFKEMVDQYLRKTVICG